ncbi:MAG TPA: hypothetical protein VHY58_16855 [Streptosporangiaceae bacterium]|nr:hypothetical protein [Streptosporangiaceae bacterium]
MFRDRPGVRDQSGTAVTAADLGDPGRLRDAAVLVHAGWAAHWGTDSLNIDNPADPARPAHQGLLGAGIPIIEHLTNLESVPDTGARLIALPAPVRGMASFPVRAVAVTGDHA